MAGPLAVLMIEDSEDDARLVSRELRRSGFDTVDRRVETEPALKAALAERTWDLILADFRMPELTCPRALELVQTAGLDVPFIVVSATIGEETAVALMKAGAHDFVLKDRLARLGAVVERELREAEERRKRRWAEAALELLADAGRLVGSAPDFESVAERTAQIAVPRLADWCIVYHARERGEGRLSEIVAIACRDGGDRAVLDQLARRYPPAPERPEPPFVDALVSRTPALIGTVGEAELARFARDPEHLRLLRALDPSSLIIIPHAIGDRVVGLLVFAVKRPRVYTEADLALAREIAGRLALILERIRLVRAREEFLATAIHEIKTPISVIKTAVQLIQQLPPEQREQRLEGLLARLDRQTNRLGRLVTEILEVYRIDSRKLTLLPSPVDLGALVERVAAEMRGVSPRHHIVVRCATPVIAEVDADRIEQVVNNLLDNAIKYSPGGGDVEIECGRDGDDAVVTVRDHGIGIPRDRQGRIFERFYRAHAGTPYEHASSLGVGLYLSNEFVTRHGGRMWFRSTEREGSCFGFRVPLAQRQEAP